MWPHLFTAVMVTLLLRSGRSVVLELAEVSERSFPDLLEAAAQLDFSDIDTVGFTFSYWLPARDALFHPIPDVDKIRSKVRRVVAGQSDPTSDAAVSDECEV